MRDVTPSGLKGLLRLLSCEPLAGDKGGTGES